MVTPVSILREQAALLGPKTNQLVKAEVSTRTEAEGALTHLFLLAVPTLDNYKFELFRVYHSMLLYPLLLTWGNAAHQLEDEKSFRDRLAVVLGSQTTKNTVNALLAQVAR